MLKQIEFSGSNAFGKRPCRQLLNDNRYFVKGIYRELSTRQVASKCEKFCIILWPIGSMKKFELPNFEFVEKICMANYDYELNDYFDKSKIARVEEHRRVVFAALDDATRDLYIQVTDFDLLIEISNDLFEAELLRLGG